MGVIMSIIVLDCGQRCVGILNVKDMTFRIYTLGIDMAAAISIIQAAEEVVTYNGEIYDLKKLGEFNGLAEPLPLSGRHSDMRSIRWDPILGSSLSGTYGEFFRYPPKVNPDASPYDWNIESDVMMTFELWKLWKAGQLPMCRENQH